MSSLTRVELEGLEMSTLESCRYQLYGTSKAEGDFRLLLRRIVLKYLHGQRFAFSSPPEDQQNKLVVHVNDAEPL